MTTFNTGNPLGSNSPKDLYDNAENLDNGINGTALTWQDRRGATRKSWNGIETDFQQFLADGSTIEFPTWEAANTAAGAGQIPLNRQVAVIGDGGSHIDPVSGITVGNSGRYVMVSAGLQWRGPDVIAAKLDSSIFKQSVLYTDLPGILAAIGDASGFALSWMQARSSDGLPTDYTLWAIEERMPNLPRSRADDPAQDPAVGLRFVDSSPLPVKYWLEARSDNGRPTDYTLGILREDLGLDATPTKERRYVGEGDSMMASNYGGGTTIPMILGGLMGKPVVNYAVSGSTAGEIGIRAGGVVPILTVPDGALPADTSQITVTWDVPGPFSGSGQPVRIYLGTVHGIPCQLSHNPADGSLLLNRIVAGTVVPLPPTVVFVPSKQYGMGYTHLLFGGRNNEPKSTALAPLAASADWYEKMGDDYLLVSVTNKSNEPSGSAGYAEVVDLNSQLRKLRPRNYVDLRGRMIREGLSIAGLTPTPADTIAISQDRIPESLMFTDGLHFNQIGRNVASRILLDELTQRSLFP